ncbi:protein translocase subunit SecD [Marinobacterium weihaiense]|uniref:Protein translocase subunit SecD n=1 Tax=Marinobacterium weihaiense TaxID=2851016 RepID=A0ABS6MAF3_9GAMM|nr:protein translocase subunit SecD [Marinobacterium weihaiense]MBV0933150.1 protein translocase subunit SecD [Marinobacterium weihaiense]
MKHFSWRALTCGLLIVCGLLSALPNFLPSSIGARLPHWYTDNTLSLGLDLQGGSHLLLQADMQALVAQSHAALADEAGSRLREAGIRFRIEDARAAPVQLRLLQPEQLPRAQSLLHELSRDPASGIKRFRMQAEGGMLTLALTEQWQAQLGQDAIDASLEVVRRRLNETGLVEPVVARQGEDAILVQMPGVADPGEVRTLLGTTARMTFHWVLAPGEAGASMMLPAQTGEERYRVAQDVALEGRHIRDAQLGFNPETGAAVVNFRLDNEGGRTFARMTADNIGRPLAIVLDDAVLTAPVIRSVIGGGSGEISGDFTPQEAGELALMLRAGALPVPLQVIEERTVGPDLGSDAIAMGLATGLAGAALVVAFMLAVYRGRGLVACLGLLLNLVLMLGILSLFRATLTLPGIAGIILTLGMAVDANILIN